MEDLNKPFTPSRFEVARRAIKIGEISDKDTFAAVGPRQQARQVPIKFPGTDVKLPCDFQQYAEAVQIAINFVAKANAK